MIETVIRDLVSTVRDLGNQLWTTFSDPAQNKEGCFDVESLQQFMRLESVPLKAGLKPAPLLRTNETIQGADVEVDLEDYCEQVMLLVALDLRHVVILSAA